MQNRLSFVVLLAAGALALFAVAAPPAAVATSCEADCDSLGLGNCPGGCSIDTSSNCTALCWETYCRAHCGLIGPGCEGQIDLHCDETEPPPEVAELPERAGWAILRHERPEDAAPVDVGVDVAALAASSPALATLAVSDARAATAPSDARRGWTSLYLRPLRGRCVQVEAEAGELRPAAAPQAAVGFYFTARADVGGRLTDLEILYSPTPRRALPLVRSVEDALRVWARQESTPIRVFGYVSVGPDGSLGHVLSGVVAADPASS